MLTEGQDEAHHVIDAYTPKPPKPWQTVLIGPLRYMLKEQRLVFLLAGIAIASLIFALSPGTSSYSSYVYHSHFPTDSRPNINAHRIIYQNRAALHSGGKIPLGLQSKGLRILVTGGAGFVGSHLVDRLIARGDSVIVADNFFTGRKDNVMHHFGNPRFELIRHDVVEPLLVEVDQIYHLACPASPVHYKHNPVKTIISLLSSVYFSSLFIL
ncbi:UDP-glucuronic acid decarboxylase 1 [Datura stramonium]|uniref:UDP-glucuronate decarboxylase n=1 Tax=Datura stramonium TaxID=4076 RepID=A0ABS8SQ79_DATST|nr:UDP-glucuronic acid decarboxylase 1 [Datura stramonium]